MTLPGMDWRDTLRTVKNASKITKVIMMARDADEDDIHLALSAGSYLVLERPLNQDRFATLIAFQSDGLFVLLRG